MMQRPLLSIGMIFKNEIRCLERCVKSLQPLRDAIPCELVMADTGSDDGSRDIAEQYADILIDFPWVDDFSAARNAVLDHCSGEWLLSIDADEWLDEDITELVQFLTVDGARENAQHVSFGSVVIRNYDNMEQDSAYVDFFAIRILRMSSGLRYTGAIHEHFDAAGTMTGFSLHKTVLYHDGYVFLGKEKGKEKTKRNLLLLRQELAKDPDNLLKIMQYIDSSREEADHWDYIRRAIQLIERKCPRWDWTGPALLRQAVMDAKNKRHPQLEEWIQKAEFLFPNSAFTRIDVQYVAFANCLDDKDYIGAIRCGEAYLKAQEEDQAGKLDPAARSISPIQSGSPYREHALKIALAEAYLEEDKPKRARELLESLDGTVLDGNQARNLSLVLQELHSATLEDTKELLLRLYGEICQPVPSKKCGDERRAEFLNMAAGFDPAYWEKEQKRERYCRPAYTLFLPLQAEKDCELATAAAVLETRDRTELQNLLAMVDSWDEFPISALEHALREGVRFPPPGKPLKIEEMDALAARMSRPDGPLADLAVKTANGDFSVAWQSLIWARGLALAAVRTYDWADEKRGMELCRAFAEIESAFLPRYYAEELLCDENIHAIPPLHRFGWTCGRAFRTLDAGDSTDYVRLLRQGLETCPEMKGMVEFLLKQLEERRQVQAAPELLALADQVRMVLAMYPADDPAVEALKQSEAYQKVAHLIEGPELGMFGGLPQ